MILSFYDRVNTLLLSFFSDTGILKIIIAVLAI